MAFHKADTVRAVVVVAADSLPNFELAEAEAAASPAAAAESTAEEAGYTMAAAEAWTVAWALDRPRAA